jgi:hypothetical protein
MEVKLTKRTMPIPTMSNKHRNRFESLPNTHFRRRNDFRAGRIKVWSRNEVEVD